MPTKNRPTVSRDRLHTVYQQWQASERAGGRSASLTGFAAVLGYQGHSAVGDMLNGHREVSAAVLRAARVRWDINPDWLLGFSDVMYVYELIESGVLEAMLAERVRAEVEARVAHDPVNGVLTAATGALLAMPDSGARLLAFVVAAAEQALRASYPATEQRNAVGAALVSAQQALAVRPNGQDVASLRRAAAILPTAFPAPSSVPMADAPPIQFRYPPTLTAKA
jgi:hypothetical protein